MNFEKIIYAKRDRVAWLTIDRPRVLNAIDRSTIKELTTAFEQIRCEDDVRVVVLTGAGDRAFSTGHDMKEPLGSIGNVRELHSQIYDLMMAIWNLDKPVVARVQGHCLGIGLDLALVCDFTVAAEDAVFGEPEIRFSSGSEFPLLPWVVGMKAAKHLMLTGDSISAAEALKIGMLTKVVPKPELDAEIEGLTRKLSNVPGFAVKMNKHNINKAFEALGLVNAMALALENVSILVSTETEERKKFARIKAEQGLKAALAWQASLFA